MFLLWNLTSTDEVLNAKQHLVSNDFYVGAIQERGIVRSTNEGVILDQREAVLSVDGTHPSIDTEIIMGN